MRWFFGLTVVAMLLVAGSALRSQPTNSLPLPVVQEVALEDSTVLSIKNLGSRTVLEVILANVSSMLPALDVRSDGAGAGVRTRGTAAGAAVEAVAAGSGSAAIFRNESGANTTSAVQILTASTGTALEVTAGGGTALQVTASTGTALQVTANGTGPAAVLKGDVRVDGRPQTSRRRCHCLPIERCCRSGRSRNARHELGPVRRPPDQRRHIAAQRQACSEPHRNVHARRQRSGAARSNRWTRFSAGSQSLVLEHRQRLAAERKRQWQRPFRKFFADDRCRVGHLEVFAWQAKRLGKSV